MRLYLNIIIMRIKEIIKEKGLTASFVAEKLGVSQSALSQALSRNTTVEMLTRIASVLGVPVVELFERPTSGHIACPKCGADIKLSAE